MDIKNLITKNTNIIIIKETFKQDPRKLSRKIKINKKIIELWNNWILIDRIYYYYKAFPNYLNQEENFINELIGEFIADYLKLATVHYSIGYNQKNNEYGLLSQSFRNNKFKYIEPDELFLNKNCINLNNIKEIKSKCKNDKNYKQLVSQILKMIALDIYMNQTDRTKNNFLFQKRKKILELSPLYDYEQSFYVDKTNTDNISKYQAYIFGLNLENIEEIKKYPELKELFKLLLKLDINNILEQIENKYQIIIPKKTKEKYEELNNKTKKLIYKSIK